MSGPHDSQGEHTVGGDAIPARLRERDQWVVTRDKEPVRPRKGWIDPTKQLSFGRALSIASGPGTEPAFALRAEDPFVVVDFDDVGEPDDLPDTVQQYIQKPDTYTEVSRSGQGYHKVYEGARLPGHQHTGSLDCGGKVEVFDANQYIVLTGHVLDGRQEVTSGGEPLQDLQRNWLPEQSTDDVHQKGTEGSFDLESESNSTLDLRSVDIRRTIWEYAAGGSHQAKRTKRLWRSPKSSSAGYPSASEADLALCSDLAFWCQKDARLMNECFEESNRYREEKWNRIAYSNGQHTYGQATIQLAIESTSDTYSADRYVIWD